MTVWAYRIGSLVPAEPVAISVSCGFSSLADHVRQRRRGAERREAPVRTHDHPDVGVAGDHELVDERVFAVRADRPALDRVPFFVGDGRLPLEHDLGAGVDGADGAAEGLPGRKAGQQCRRFRGAVNGDLGGDPDRLGRAGGAGRGGVVGGVGQRCGRHQRVEARGFGGGGADRFGDRPDGVPVEGHRLGGLGCGFGAFQPAEQLRGFAARDDPRLGVHAQFAPDGRGRPAITFFDPVPFVRPPDAAGTRAGQSRDGEADEHHEGREPRGLLVHGHFHSSPFPRLRSP